MAKEKIVDAEKKDFIALAVLEPGFLIIKSQLRYGVKASKDKTFLPPSDFFVVKQGDTKFPVGAEVVLKPGARMAPFKDEESVYIVEKEEINCHFPA